MIIRRLPALPHAAPHSSTTRTHTAASVPTQLHYLRSERAGQPTIAAALHLCGPDGVRLEGGVSCGSITLA